jgi:cephalosporin hydroxylase
VSPAIAAQVTALTGAHPDIAHSVAEWGRHNRQRPTWRGQLCQQFPADMMRYAEWIWELRPPFVIEIGVAEGGTTLFLADTLDAVAEGGLVLAVDIKPITIDHPSVIPILGDSTSIEVAEVIDKMAEGRRGMVLLDGSHHPDHVLAELEMYSPLADALVVEDTIMRWLPQYIDGPHSALDHWLPEHPEWEAVADPVPGPTQHPGGWLRRV